MEIEEILKLGGVIISGAVGYGILQGKVKTLSEKANKLEHKSEVMEDRIQTHAINMAEIRADMKHVVTSLNTIELKLDKILQKGEK